MSSTNDACPRPQQEQRSRLRHLLVNTLLVSVINFTMWFAVTFWVFLETKSVLATGMVAASSCDHGLSGIWFGRPGRSVTRKKSVMQALSCLAGFLCRRVHALPADAGADLQQSRQRDCGSSIVLTMLGVITGNIRSIACRRW
jgi:DHA3 family multidrug efflux protein-like MFS transporter